MKKEATFYNLDLEIAVHYYYLQPSIIKNKSVIDFYSNCFYIYFFKKKYNNDHLKSLY